MRRFITVILCIFLLSTTVYADNAAASYSATATVSPTGSCQVVLTATIRLETAVSSLTFPLGENVSSISLNGGRASTTSVGDITHVKLNYLRNQVGSFPITVQYTVSNVVQTDEEGRQIIVVPLLSGFKYPVEALQFSVTMPGSFTDSPEFFSGYHQQDIERVIDYSVSGVTISGKTTAVLKDSETLRMVLVPPEGMFPLAAVAGESLFVDHICMGIFAALALGYWLLTMRRMPFLPGKLANPPEGLSAGSIGSYLVHANSDLTMMVIHWAQMGYLTIHVHRNGRIFLHKKMDMGNERSFFEGKCFASLFSRGPRIEAATARYARLCDQVASSSRRHAAGLQSGSGNPLLFRLLACGVGLFAGIAMGDCIGSPSAVMRIVWMSLMAMVSAFACWHIQQGMNRIHLQNKQDLMISLGVSAALMVLSLLCNAPLYGAIAVGWSMVSGFMAAYGGRRTESGLQMCAEILGLRRFLRKVSTEELQRIAHANPEYYYEMAPFALALGVDKRFARQFGSVRLPSCKWLVTEVPAPQTPQEWFPLLRRTVRTMNRNQHRPLWKIILNIR